MWIGEGKGDAATLPNVRNLGCEPEKIKKTKQIQSWQENQRGDQKYKQITEGMQVAND